MPSKHIDDVTWRKVEKETLKAIQGTNCVFKETEVLKVLILKGLESITEEDYEKIASKKRKG